MEVEKDSSALFRQDAEIGVLLLLNGPLLQEKRNFSHLTLRGLDSQVAQSNNKVSCLSTIKLFYTVSILKIKLHQDWNDN